MSDGWRRLFDIKAGEGQVVSLLLAHSLFMGISLVFFETAASALFLARFPAEGLPYAFIGTAFLVPLTGVVYNRLRNRLSTPHLWAGTLLFLLAVPLAATALLHATSEAWPTLILMVLVNALYALTALEFWGVAGRVLNLRQARRLYGLIGSGEVAAGIIGGFAVVPILRIVSVKNLMLVAAAGFLVCLICLFDLLRNAHEGSAEEEEDEDETANQSILGLLRAVAKDRYILLIVGLYLFYNLTHETLEYTNLSQIQAYFRQNEGEVAGYIGVLLSAREIVTLVARTFLSSRLLSRFGLGAGLAATPVLMMAGSAALVAISTTIPRLPLFWFLAFLKIAEGAVRNSLSKPAIMMAYRPLAPQRRDRAQIVIETAIEPISTGLTGVMLLVLNLVLAGASPARKAMGAGGLMFTTACGWLVMGRLLRREYTSVVMAALSRGSLRAEVLTLDDSAIALITNQLHASQAGEVIYLLKVMQESMPPARYAAVLLGLLDHPKPEVRAAVVGRIENLRLSSFLPVLSRCLESEESPQVQASLLRALAAGDDSEMIRRISPFLQDPSTVIRRSALAGLLKYGGLAGVMRAGEYLLALLKNPDPQQRIMAAEIVGDVGIQSFYLPLRQLLADCDTGVRVAALEAAGQLKHDWLWPEIADQLAVPLIWQSASRTLVAGGDGAIPAIEALIARADVGLSAKRRSVRVLGRIGTPAAVAALRPQVGDRTGLRQVVVKALQDCQYRATGRLADEIDVEIRREAERAAGLFAALVDISSLPNHPVLLQALRQEIARSQDILFSLLAFLYHPGSMRKARTYWRSGSPEKRTFALEVLDNLCERRHKILVMPLVEDLSPEDVRRKLTRHFPEPLLGGEARLKQIAAEPPPWATKWMGVWAGYAPREDRVDSGRPGMLSTIEKVLLLKSAEFFLTTDDDVLVELAALASEVPVVAGERIVERGKVESTMYLIASGTVRVHEGEQTLAEMGRGSVFGELAALDSQPRTADVTALTEGVLLKIDNATLVDLMAEHIEVAHGIIRFLIHRYRPSSKAT